MSTHRLTLTLIAASTVLCAPASAGAATVLFVSTTGATDTNIASVLTGDGHTVTMAAGTGVLAGDLSAYDAVFWSAYNSFSVPASTFTNLTTYVMGGGRVFVTGFNAAPGSTAIVNFCGGTGVNSFPGLPGAVRSIDNSLTVGVVDIRGVTPTGGHSDLDGLTGLMAGTVEVVPSAVAGSSQWTLRTLGEGEIAFVSNGTFSGGHPSWDVTTPGGPGAYNAAIRNFAAGSDTATTEPGAPEIEFDDVRGADEGAAVTLTVTVTDPEGDTLSYSWDLDDDGTFGENMGMPSYTIAAGTTDGPGSVRLSVQARDAGGRTSTLSRRIAFSNVAPTITSSAPTFSSVGAAYLYDIEVDEPGGDLDPLTFTLVTGPDRMVISDEGRISWTPNEMEITGPGETIPVAVTVSDDDMAEAMQMWELIVSPNRAPTVPSTLYPDNVVIGERRPNFRAGNSTDPDRDPLQYFFQVDSVDTFDSPDLQESGAVDQMPGFTTWMAPSDLDFGDWHWRVWAFDGTVETEPAQSRFTVSSGGVPDTGTPPPSDGGLSLPDAGGGGGGGGGCALGGAGSGAGVAALAFLLLLGTRGRRR